MPGIPTDGRGIICYENDGAFKFRTAPDAFDYNEWGGPSLEEALPRAACPIVGIRSGFAG